ncbi:hypothetical protein [Actinacidiphila epipremni]|uniref:Uncharacterized protein n=1 Tax=Actinacidiphila epipremni TaxID=2053013 RepID=A0ABX0ZZK8_9ACTN|nr:hypothetical protein [Actinacidiphila epipremni]NJP47144.1 hypothetical protein [Actinacidiphila epipremni]
MGWTHDYRDVSRTPRRSAAVAGSTAPMELFPPGEARLGIPRILRRRARWVGARLRHSRG